MRFALTDRWPSRILCCLASGIGLVVLLPIGPAPASARGKSLSAQAISTLEQARSVMVTVHSEAPRHSLLGVLAPRLSVTEIVLQNGRRYEEYVDDRADGQESVQTATQQCWRYRPQRTWSCQQLANPKPWSFFDHLVAGSWTALGKAPCGQQQCRLFRAQAIPFGHNERVRVTLHVDALTRRIVEMDTHLIIGAHPPLGSFIRTDFTFLFSRWNDPSLRAVVPRVPDLSSGI